MATIDGFKSQIGFLESAFLSNDVDVEIPKEFYLLEMFKHINALSPNDVDLETKEFLREHCFKYLKVDHLEKNETLHKTCSFALSKFVNWFCDEPLLKPINYHLALSVPLVNDRTRLIYSNSMMKLVPMETKVRVAYNTVPSFLLYLQSKALRAEAITSEGTRHKDVSLNYNTNCLEAIGNFMRKEQAQFENVSRDDIIEIARFSYEYQIDWLKEQTMQHILQNGKEFSNICPFENDVFLTYNNEKKCTSLEFVGFSADNIRLEELKWAFRCVPEYMLPEELIISAKNDGEHTKCHLKDIDTCLHNIAHLPIKIVRIEQSVSLQEFYDCGSLFEVCLSSGVLKSLNLTLNGLKNGSDIDIVKMLHWVAHLPSKPHINLTLDFLGEDGLPSCDDASIEAFNNLKFKIPSISLTLLNFKNQK